MTGLGGVAACSYILSAYSDIWRGELKRDLMEILACPVCKGGLELRVELEDGGEVVTGWLDCGVCDDGYPIEDSIPNLLPADLRGELG